MRIDESKISLKSNETHYSLYYDNQLIKVPESVAIILDGNGRYAEKNHLPRALGHKAGCEALEVILEETVKLNIKYLTVYAFSTENWKRSEEEVSALMFLLINYLNDFAKRVDTENIKIQVIKIE